MSQLTPLELVTAMEKQVLVVDANCKAVAECLGEFEEVYPAACGESIEDRDNALFDLIQLWLDNRDRVRFMVWTDAAQAPPTQVIVVAYADGPDPDGVKQ